MDVWIILLIVLTLVAVVVTLVVSAVLFKSLKRHYKATLNRKHAKATRNSFETSRESDTSCDDENIYKNPKMHDLEHLCNGYCVKHTCRLTVSKSELKEPQIRLDSSGDTGLKLQVAKNSTFSEEVNNSSALTQLKWKSAKTNAIPQTKTAQFLRVASQKANRNVIIQLSKDSIGFFDVQKDHKDVLWEISVKSHAIQKRTEHSQSFSSEAEERLFKDTAFEGQTKNGVSPESKVFLNQNLFEGAIEEKIHVRRVPNCDYIFDLKLCKQIHAHAAGETALADIIWFLHFVRSEDQQYVMKFEPIPNHHFGIYRLITENGGFHWIQDFKLHEISSKLGELFQLADKAVYCMLIWPENRHQKDGKKILRKVVVFGIGNGYFTIQKVDDSVAELNMLLRRFKIEEKIEDLETADEEKEVEMEEEKQHEHVIITHYGANDCENSLNHAAYRKELLILGKMGKEAPPNFHGIIGSRTRFPLSYLNDFHNVLKFKVKFRTMSVAEAVSWSFEKDDNISNKISGEYVNLHDR